MKMKINQIVVEDIKNADKPTNNVDKLEQQSFWSRYFGCCFQQRQHRVAASVTHEFSQFDLEPKGKFNSNYIRGTYCGAMNITLQKVKADNNIAEISCLLRSPYFLTHHFEFIGNNGSNYYMKESFCFTINEIIKDPNLRGNPYKINFKAIFGDLTKAFQFAETAMISNFNLTLSTIAVTVLNETTSIHKIMDLSQAKRANSPIEFKKDIAAFGNVLLMLLDACIKCIDDDPSRFFLDNWLESDGVILNDVISRMIPDNKSNKRTKYNQLPTIEKISKHSFTWNTMDKVNSFIRSVKILESTDWEKFKNILKKGYGAEEELKQWTKCIEPEILDHLSKIRMKSLKTTKKNEKNMKNGKNDIFSLVKTVRNMVRLE